MIITLTRTGGITGIPLKKIVDTTKIAKNDAAQIEALVTKESFAQGQEVSTPPSPDRFTYAFSIQNGELSQRIQLHESSLTQTQEKLIKLLLDTKY